MGVEDEMLFVVFGEDLEVIVLRYTNRAAQGGVDQLPDAFGVGGVLLFFEIDANQWHGKTPGGGQVHLKYMMDDLYQTDHTIAR
ncbi:hypothetical protein D3C73_1293690 [compost metagenome]